MIKTEINIIGIAFSEGLFTLNWSSQTPHKTTASTIPTTTVSTKSIALSELSLCTLYLLFTQRKETKKPNSTLVAMVCKRESKLDLKQRKSFSSEHLCTLMLKHNRDPQKKYVRLVSAPESRELKKNTKHQTSDFYIFHEIKTRR